MQQPHHHHQSISLIRWQNSKSPFAAPAPASKTLASSHQTNNTAAKGQPAGATGQNAYTRRMASCGSRIRRVTLLKRRIRVVSDGLTTAMHAPHHHSPHQPHSLAVNTARILVVTLHHLHSQWPAATLETCPAAKGHLSSRHTQLPPAAPPTSEGGKAPPPPLQQGLPGKGRVAWVSLQNGHTASMGMRD